MKLIGSFKRVVAALCTAVLLTCGVSALAVSPAEVPASAPLSAANSASEAQLRSTLSKFNVSFDSKANGWQIDSPYEDAGLEKASCGLYPYLFISKADSTVYLSLGMTYFGSQKLDMKTVRVETETNYYDFTCDDEYAGFCSKDSGIWFDYEIFDMDDTPEWFTEWLNAKSVKATFTGKDGTTKTYTLTKDNLQAIRDILNAYNLLLDSDVSTASSILNELSK